MNRRDFLRTALAGFTILPGAGRVWRAVREPEPVSIEDFTCVMVGGPDYDLYCETYTIASDVVWIENFRDDPRAPIPPLPAIVPVKWKRYKI